MSGWIVLEFLLILFIKLELDSGCLASINLPLPWSRTLTFKKIFAKSKFSPALFEKIPSFVCLVFKIENKLILK